MNFLKSAALFAIDKVTKVNSPLAVSTVGKIVRSSDDQDIKDRGFNGLLGMKGNFYAYRKAIEIFGQEDNHAFILINKIMRDVKKEDRTSLLLFCLDENNSTEVKQEIFTSLCDLSQSEDMATALDAQETVAALFYQRDEYGKYTNIAHLAAVLENAAKKTQSPASLMPLFAAVTNPKSGLADFVDAKFSQRNLQDHECGYKLIDLRAVFERIETRYKERGYKAPPLSDVYAMLRTAAALEEEIGQVYADKFGLDRS